MGAWMVLLALGRLRNETVWLNWAPGWFRLPARIAADSQAALGCISFPSIARLQPEGGTAVRSIPLMWHKRKGGFVARPKPGISVTARVRGGFNSVPHLMFGVWNRTDLLPPRPTAFTWRDYLHAYHEMAQLVRVRPACAPPIALQRAEPLEAAEEAASTRLRLFVHLRRTDRGGEDDVRLGGAKGRGARSRFEVQTHDAIRSLLEELTRQLAHDGASARVGDGTTGGSLAAAVEWVVLSDDMAHARAALQLIGNASVQARARARGVAHRAHAAPANHSTWSFFSFRHASGIVQSCIRDGWSSYSSIPALMWDVPLYSVHEAVPEKYAAMAHYLPPDLAADERLVYARPDAPAFVRRVLSRHAAAPPTAARPPEDLPLLGGGRSARRRPPRGVHSMAGGGKKRRRRAPASL